MLSCQLFCLCPNSFSFGSKVYLWGRKSAKDKTVCLQKYSIRIFYPFVVCCFWKYKYIAKNVFTFSWFLLTFNLKNLEYLMKPRIEKARFCQCFLTFFAMKIKVNYKCIKFAMFRKNLVALQSTYNTCATSAAKLGLHSILTWYDKFELYAEHS